MKRKSILILTLLLMCGCTGCADGSVSDSATAGKTGDTASVFDAAEEDAGGWTETVELTDNGMGIKKIYIAVDEFENAMLNLNVIDVSEVDMTAAEEENLFPSTVCGTDFTVYYMDSHMSDTAHEVKWGADYGEASPFHRTCVEWCADIPEACPDDFSYSDNVVLSRVDTEEDNRCDIDRDAAKDMADGYFSELGIDNMAYYETVPVIWLNRAEWTDSSTWSSVQDGYCIRYVLNVDGENIAFEEHENVYEQIAYLYHDYSGNTIGPDTSFEVYVNDDGVFCMRYNNPVTVDSVDTSVGILPVEDAKELLLQGLNDNTVMQHFAAEPDEEVVLDTLRLRYYRFKTGAGYQYRAVYELSNSDYYEDYIGRTGSWYRYFIAVDAVTGSYVDIINTMY